MQHFNDDPEKHLFVRFDAFLKWRIQGIFILEFILHFAEYKKDGGPRMQVSTRTSQDMDGALHTDFANFYTMWGSTTKISALLQLS